MENKRQEVEGGPVMVFDSRPRVECVVSCRARCNIRRNDTALLREVEIKRKFGIIEPAKEIVDKNKQH